jgi:hypothetical protein
MVALIEKFIQIKEIPVLNHLINVIKVIKIYRMLNLFSSLSLLGRND